ncbi:hypothetical protein QTG56_23775 (plasmid) [Rossellomorea sp. AcN35-11]|nr:hypothetical protein [Rossellomorea aquimaris]WJV32381.1 hypothetical protein QTG56_23775 [Rossellomorea sp. AcN35-11]
MEQMTLFPEVKTVAQHTKIQYKRNIPIRPDSFYEKKEEAQLIVNFSLLDERVGMYYGEWIVTTPYDPALQVLSDRHYSRQTKGSPHTGRPGYKLALRTSDGKAGWRSWYGKRDDGLTNVWECSFFRNEAPRKYLASTMIKFGVYATICEWKKREGEIPYAEEGFVTYVDPCKVNTKTEAGFSYKKAGFKEIGKSKSGKILLKLDLYDNYLTILEMQWIEYFRYLQKVIRVLMNSESNDIYYLAALKREASSAESEITAIRAEMKMRGLEESMYDFKPLYILNMDEMNKMIDTINYLKGEGRVEDLAKMYPLIDIFTDPTLIQQWKY